MVVPHPPVLLQKRLTMGCLQLRHSRLQLLLLEREGWGTSSSLCCLSSCQVVLLLLLGG